uniref:Glucosylceramidase n=1 Tax=Ditylenchus dipsaci TaxID=166011 RepID=A0A915E836_9BILA
MLFLIGQRALAKIIMNIAIVILLFSFVGSAMSTDIQKSVSSGECEKSFVCVCTGTNCDIAEPLGDLAEEQIVFYTSSKESDRFKRETASFNDKSESVVNEASAIPVTIKVDASKKFQSIVGFGGAFTDSAGINFKALSEAAQQKLLESYFGDKGLNYTIGRVPIASCDFSTREYSYLDKENDFELESFALAKEDFDYKIPYINKAQELANGNLKMFASPWSAPGWMKDSGRMKGGVSLKGPFNGKYYETYAKYFVRFLEEYAKHGINFWAITIQNEPSTALDPNWGWQTMWLSAKQQRGFANALLSPALKQSEVGKQILIMAHDHNRDEVFDVAKDIYTDPQEDDAIDGMGLHWYTPGIYENLEKVHGLNKDKFLFATEACTGFLENEHIPLLGDWQRGEQYGLDILNDLKHWVTGWTDWNLALDLEGDEFYKQPMYYFLGHFSKFVLPNSVRLNQMLRKQKKTTRNLLLWSM